LPLLSLPVCGAPQGGIKELAAAVGGVAADVAAADVGHREQ
jgi:hypothetical protein